MIEILKNQIELLTPIIKAKNPAYWNSLKIRYEEPFVDRLWVQTGKYRFCIHRIYKGESALWHPHDWPSAVKIISGSYEMGFGTVWEILSRSIFTKDSYYEMLNPQSYHSIHTISNEVLSFMLMGEKYSNVEKFEKPPKQEELSNDEKLELLIKTCLCM